MTWRSLLLATALCAGPVLAQETASPASHGLAQQAAERFPQPVRVGSLIGRRVLQPTESQPVLGRVRAVTRRADGGLDMIVQFGGFLGLGARPIAVPVEAVALLGEYVAVVGFTPGQLKTFPSVAGWGANTVGPDSIIHVGVVRPFH